MLTVAMIDTATGAITLYTRGLLSTCPIGLTRKKAISQDTRKVIKRFLQLYPTEVDQSTANLAAAALAPCRAYSVVREQRGKGCHPPPSDTTTSYPSGLRSLPFFLSGLPANFVFLDHLSSRFSFRAVSSPSLAPSQLSVSRSFPGPPRALRAPTTSASGVPDQPRQALASAQVTPQALILSRKYLALTSSLSRSLLSSVVCSICV